MKEEYKIGCCYTPHSVDKRVTDETLVVTQSLPFLPVKGKRSVIQRISRIPSMLYCTPAADAATTEHPTALL